MDAVCPASAAEAAADTWLTDRQAEANGQLARVFLTLLDTELKRTDAISGWNPSPVGSGRAEPEGIE